MACTLEAVDTALSAAFFAFSAAAAIFSSGVRTFLGFAGPFDRPGPAGSLPGLAATHARDASGPSRKDRMHQWDLTSGLCTNHDSWLSVVVSTLRFLPTYMFSFSAVSSIALVSMPSRPARCRRTKHVCLSVPGLKRAANRLMSSLGSSSSSVPAASSPPSPFGRAGSAPPSCFGFL